jgi:hypothetical protein
MSKSWETRKLIPISIETRKKHSETNIRIGHKPPSQKSKHPTKETIEKRKNTYRLNKLKR